MWEREISDRIRATGVPTPLAVVMIRGAGPVWGTLAAQDLAAGRVHLAPLTPLAAGRLPFGDGSRAAVVLSFIGTSPAVALRQQLLADIHRALTADGRLLLLDHNRPRRRLAALRAVATAPVPPGGSPSARWRRLAHPTAREAQGAGLVVDSLQLLAGERVQLVVARREASTHAGQTGS